MKFLKGNLVTILIILAVIAIGTSLFFLFFEYAPYDDDDWNPSREARLNPYLGAELFLKEFDLEVSSERSIEPDLKKDSKAQTLIFTDMSKIKRDEDFFALWTWAESGGNLIFCRQDEGFDDVFNFDDWEETDELAEDRVAEFIGFSIEEPSNSEDYKHGEMKGDTGFLDFENASPVIYQLPEHMAPSGPYTIHSYIINNDGFNMLSFQIGGGYLHIVNHASWLNNDRLKLEDHGEILLRMVKPEERYQEVTIFRPLDDRGPRESFLLFERALPFVIAFVLSIIMLLWFMIPRFGSIQPDPPPIRRELMEHISASGHFLWRHQDHTGLLNTMRTLAWERVRARRPDWARLPEKECFQKLAELIEVNGFSLHQAFRGDALHDPQDFTNKVKMLEKLRRHL